jgi:hypothetical protein
VDTETLQPSQLTVHDGVVDTAAQPDLTAAIEIVKLRQQAAHGANWFFWIAGLSLVNTFLLLHATEIYFPAGLAAVQIPAAFGALSGSGAILALGLMFGALVAALFVFFGVMGRRRHEWAFLAGLILYAIDGLLFLIVLDIIAIGFHTLACFGIYRGLKATSQIATASIQSPTAT